MLFPEVSIIIPIYNAEHSLDRMLNCILNQTFRDFEVIMVDDGSIDKSSAICDEYQLKDKRFRAIHKKNEGVSTARQIGITQAHGKYVIHADADDWLESDMLERLYNEAVKTDADVVFCDFFVNESEREIYRNQNPNSSSPIDALQAMFQQLHGSCCNKLVLRACYSKYRCYFPKGIDYCEDLLFWVQVLQHKEVKITYLNKAFYHYVMNNNSITHHVTRKTYETRLKFIDKLNELLYLPNASEIMEQVSFGIFTEGFIHNVLTKEEIKDGLKRYKNQIKQLKSLKWRMGFTMLSCNMSNFAHKLIHY